MSNIIVWGFCLPRKNLASFKLRMSPDCGCLCSIFIRVLVYSGFSPGHKAGPRWLLLTREQCMTDHVRLFDHKAPTLFICALGQHRSTYKKSSRLKHLAFSIERNINSYQGDKY